jgi:hypothetical protein
MKYIFENTDEEIYVTSSEVRTYLDGYGIVPPDRHTLKNNIDNLNDFFYETGLQMCVQVFRQNKQNCYQFCGKPLSYDDVVTLVTEIKTSSTLDEMTRVDLSEKLLSFVARDKRKNISTAIHKTTANGGNYASYTLGCIVDAINSHKFLNILYHSAESDKQHIITPYVLLENKSYHYVIANCREHSNPFSMFRVDRILKIEVMDEKSQPLTDELKAELEKYINAKNDLSYGEAISFNIIFESRAERTVTDRYKTASNIFDMDDGKKLIHVTDTLSNPLLGWFFAHWEYIRTDNEKIIAEMKKRMTVFNESVGNS